jgi:16S rRNA (guanine(527)-N(7))-methyltransferase RsmG
MPRTDKAEMNLTPQANKFSETLSAEGPTYGVSLTSEDLNGLSEYFELLQRWNSRVHLVAPCSPPEFATRHVLESLTVLKHLPEGTRVAEVGAGAGLPILPCLIVRSDLQAILIEAAQKKAVFLREALSQMNLSTRASVVNERFENVPVAAVDVVTCRALERFEEMLPHLLQWAPPRATLLLFGSTRLATRVESLGFSTEAELMPQSKSRYLFIVNKVQARG